MKKTKTHEKYSMNRINMILTIMLASLFIFDLLIRLSNDQVLLHNTNIRILILIIIQLINIAILPKKHYKLNASLTLASFCAAFILYPVLGFSFGSADYLLVYLVGIGLSVATYLIFDYQSDIRLILVWNVIIFISILVTSVAGMHLLLDKRPLSAEIFMKNPIIYVVFLAVVIFIHSVIISFRQSLTSLNLKIENKQQDLDYQVVQLEKQERSLAKQNRKLEEVSKNLKNTYHLLDEEINKRKEELEDRNQQILKYAFMNSHMLRASILRMKGLLMLNPNGTDRQVKQMLDKEIHELKKTAFYITEASGSNKAKFSTELESRVRQLYG